MKIVFIISSLRFMGGSERVATLIANEMSRSHQVQIIVRGSPAVGFELSDRVAILSLSSRRIAFFFELRAAIANSKPDLIIIHSMHVLGLFCALSTFGLLCRKWVLEHVSYASSPKLVQLAKLLIYPALERVIVLTEADKASYSRFHASVAVVRNPCPFPLTHIPYEGRSKTIVAVGRHSYQKGFDMLVDAWALVSVRAPDWKLYIYGDGSGKEALQKKVELMGLSQSLILHSATNDIARVYKSAGFLVMTSRYEGLPMVLIEAQTFGLPIISFDCPNGPAEIIEHGVDGLLVENGNISQMAKSMLAMIEDEAFRARCSEAAYQSAERYSSAAIMAKWRELMGVPSEL